MTGMLADLGADVIWVERPGGDPFRSYAPAASSVFNRNKRSVECDLKSDDGRQAVSRLLVDADLFVESWRPGVADSFDLGWMTLHERFPGLIYCSISGFGADSRWRDVPGFEPIVFALAGTMADQAGHREPPIFQGLPFASIGAGYLGLIGTLAALYRRDQDGVGRRVETSLFDGAMAYHAMLWGESDQSLSGLPGTSTDIRLSQGTSGRRIVTRSFQCADDGYIGVHTGAVGAFGRLMKVLGLDDRIPSSESGMDMAELLDPDQQALLINESVAIFATQPRDYWVEKLLEADVCGIEHLQPGESFDKPQVRHNQMVVEVDDPYLGRIQQVGTPVKLDGVDFNPPRPAPRPGDHTADLLGSGASTAPVALPSGTPDRRPLLDGIRVLDLGAYYAGPFTSRMLADLGADVIKVEPVRGDQLRGLERPFFAAQAGKRSVAADLKHPELEPAVHGLIEWADVVHHNLRPGAAERLGLDYDSVAAVRPDSVYLYAPGWGSSGPHQHRQSFAPMLSGYVGVTFEVAGRYQEPMPPVGNEDPGNGLVGVVGVLLALLIRQRTGKGSYIENSQLNATMTHMAHVVRTIDGGVLGAGSLDTMQYGLSALERLFSTRDGWVCVVALDDDRAGRLGEVLGIDIRGDERFSTFESRRQHDDDLGELLEDAIAAWSTADLLKALDAENIPAIEPSGRIIHELMNDPDLRRRRRVAETHHAAKGNVREFDLFFTVSDAEFPSHRLAPELGADTAEVLGSLGFTEEDLARLRDSGIIAMATP